MGHVLNTTSYNALISAHSKAGELPAVLETYQRMCQQVPARPLPPACSSAPACATREAVQAVTSCRPCPAHCRPIARAESWFISC